MAVRYPEWWNTSITIFNKYENPITQVVTWYKHNVDGCFWKYIGDKVNVGQTVLETNNITCRIPENPIYMEKYIWEQLPNAYMGDYFTLGAGDIIVKGSVSDIIDEYQDGKRSSDLIAKYKNLQGCMEIELVANNTGVGLGIPHYHVRGI